MRDLIRDVVNLCYEITRQSKCDCFFEYSGHCNIYYVRCFRDGWHQNMTADDYHNNAIAFCLDFTEKNLLDTKHKLQTIADELGVQNG